jgi:hypothetical protein
MTFKIIVAAMAISFCSFSQGSMYDNSGHAEFEFGVGVGFDYGGIGLRLTGMPSARFGFFGSVGYAFAGLGFNGGLNFVANPGSIAEVYGTGMYGYNAAQFDKFSNSVQTGKLYYGPSFGVGLKINFSGGHNFINGELLVPVRSEAAKVDLPPVAISVGYHWKF